MVGSSTSYYKSHLRYIHSMCILYLLQINESFEDETNFKDDRLTVKFTSLEICTYKVLLNTSVLWISYLNGLEYLYEMTT